MSYLIRYTTAPSLRLKVSCSGSSCGDDTIEWDADGGTCTDCGTTWNHDAGDCDTGELYESWSGETRTGPIVNPAEWQAHQDVTLRGHAVCDRPGCGVVVYRGAIERPYCSAECAEAYPAPKENMS